MILSHPARRAVVGVLLAATAVCVAACGGETAGSAVPVSAFDRTAPDTSAPPADQLTAAMTSTVMSGPYRVSTESGGVRSEGQIDAARRIVLWEEFSGGAAAPDQSLLLRDDAALVRFSTAVNGAEAGTWYRMADTEESRRTLSVLFDVDAITSLVDTAIGVEVKGSGDVDGSRTTHFVVTPDPKAVVDLAMRLLPSATQDLDASELKDLEEKAPEELHYWVNRDGYLVREDDGFRVKTYRAFGVPLRLPAVDASAAPVLAGS
ncbi:hypothetical protein ACFYVR_19360 [Rhodococcus sp. NPDC003318]|uniref:hypothetical protein n=1 Tax=Rhodococcus sp. NPDC003318 TaxID=3364503 RepID=UPI0036A2A41C